MKPQTAIDPLRKLTPDSRNRHQFRSRCCSLKTLKRVGFLLAFHVLNVVVAVAGVISVAVMLASIALMTAWLLTLPLVLMVLALWAVSQISNKCLKYFAYAVVMVLYFASYCIHWIVAVAPWVGFYVVGVDLVFFFVSVIVMKLVVKADVHLANFGITAASPNEAISLRPDECADRFSLSEVTDVSCVLPLLRMTRRAWVAVLYFAVVKVFMGVASAAIIIFVLIQPAAALFSGGNVPILVSQLTFHNNSVIYIVLIVATWVAGIMALPTVARFSVKITSAVCGEWKSKQAQAAVEHHQTEADIEAAIPVTPEHDSSTTSFEELKPVTAAAPSA